MNAKTFPINAFSCMRSCKTVLYSTGFAIFISRRQYWKFDPVQRKVLEGYPRYIGADFFGCNMP